MPGKELKKELDKQRPKKENIVKDWMKQIKKVPQRKYDMYDLCAELINYKELLENVCDSNMDNIKLKKEYRNKIKLLDEMITELKDILGNFILD